MPQQPVSRWEVSNSECCNFCRSCPDDKTLALGVDCHACPQMEHQELPEAVRMLRRRLRELTATQAPQALHWRYGIMAEALQVGCCLWRGYNRCQSDPCMNVET